MIFRPGPNYALNDPAQRARVAEVIAQMDIELVIETGLNDGGSTVEFCRMARWVIGIDNDQECVEATRARLIAHGLVNFELTVGDSPAVLHQLAPLLSNKTMFFLDAHWGPTSPILDEIAALPRHSGVIVFHDFKVPGYDEGFDSVELPDGTSVDLDYALVAPALDDWSESNAIEYLPPLGGCKRGMAIVYPEAR